MTCAAGGVWLAVGRRGQACARALLQTTAGWLTATAGLASAAAVRPPPLRLPRRLSLFFLRWRQAQAAACRSLWVLAPLLLPPPPQEQPSRPPARPCCCCPPQGCPWRHPGLSWARHGPRARARPGPRGPGPAPAACAWLLLLPLLPLGEGVPRLSAGSVRGACRSGCITYIDSRNAWRRQLQRPRAGGWRGRQLQRVRGCRSPCGLKALQTSANEHAHF